MTTRITSADDFVLDFQGPLTVRSGSIVASVASTASGLKIIDSVDLLPAAVGGVRTLEPSTAYYFTGEIDLEGDRIVLSDSTVLLGTSSETAVLKSTGLASTVPFITAAHGGPNPIQNLRIEGVGIAFDIDGLGGSNAALDWLALSIVDCGAVGTIRDITNLVVNTSAWINSGTLTLDGTIATAAWFQTLWTLPIGSGATAVECPATLTITRRMRFTYSPMFVPPGCTGFNIVDRNATFPLAESLGMLFVGFSGGGTYLAGASYVDDKTVIQSTIGIPNSSPSSHVFITSNVTPTVVSSAGVYYPAAGAAQTGDYVSKFTVSSWESTYTGAVSRFFRLEATLAITSGANKQIAVRFVVNGVTLPDTTMKTTSNSGGRAESFATFGVTQLDPGDTVGIAVANLSGTNDIIITDAQFTIAAVAG